MQVSVEAPSKLERRVTVVVPIEKLNEAVDKRVAEMAKTARVDGFRRGKVPLTIIKQRYGQTIHQEALGDVIQTSLYDAINQEKLNPVGTPVVEPKAVLPDQPLEFIATFEVLPQIEKVDFTLTNLEKQIATITEEDIDRVLTHLSQQHVRWEEVERPLQEKDQAVIDFSGSIDGVPFSGGQAHDYPIVLGSKTMIPGFEEGVIGLSAGDEKVIQVEFPQTYFAKEVAGKKADFSIKVIKTSQPILPAWDDALVKKLGVKSGNLDDLRAEIRKNLERELDRVIKNKLKKQVFDHLISENPLEIPKALIEREAKRIHDELHPHHKGHAHDHSDEEMAQFNQAGERNVILGLLMAELIKQYHITANPERLKAHIANIASAYEKPEQVLTWYANNKQAKAEAEMQVLEDEILEKLLEQVQVTEKLLTYQELVSN